MKKQLLVKDHKNWLGYTFWNTVNEVVLHTHFSSIELIGTQNVPKTGSFLLVSNHCSRWDGLLVQHLIGRRANYMVSPNELIGAQGGAIRAVGAFPADPRYNIMEHMRKQIEKGEPVVIFPEGTVYYDGTTHTFKKGAARIVLSCGAEGVSIPIIPMGINYTTDALNRSRAHGVVGTPIDAHEYIAAYLEEPQAALSRLSTALHREVCHLRHAAGATMDNDTLFVGKKTKSWANLAIPCMVEVDGAVAR